MRNLRNVVYFFLVVLCIGQVMAQADECPALVQSAIEAVGNLCAGTGLNQACYGNVSLKADPQPGVTDFVFDKPGDRARIANVKSLQVDPFDNVKKEWGVALMRLQANIPDTLPGQSVSFLVFGDVQLENKVDSATSPLITLASNSVLLGEPKTDATLVGALTAGDQAFALSQSADGEWVRIELAGSDSRTGWIPSSLVQQAGELPVFDPNAANPMQAFSLQTGVTGVKCAGAPQDGILVQTPGGGDIKIKLTVNNVNVELGSTAFIQAQPSNVMRFSVIEGKGSVESNGQTVDVPAGSWVSVPMDENLEPAGTISQPKGYQIGDMDNLPVGLLGRPITVAQPIIAADTFLCVSNPNGAWIRQQANSANQTILRVLAVGDRVIDSGSTTNDGSQTWRQVETADEQVTGWVEDASLSNCGNTPTASVTTTPAVLENCTPRADWTLTYTVQTGNTLAEIARASEVSLSDLALGNCIADVNRIVAGQKLRVPKLVIIVTALPPIQPPQVGITPSATTDNGPQISSGRWQITVTMAWYVDCMGYNAPVVNTITPDVTVSADQQTLTFTAETVSIVRNAEDFIMQRRGPTSFVGTWLDGTGSATMTLTGSNQAVMTASVPCAAS